MQHFYNIYLESGDDKFVYGKDALTCKVGEDRVSPELETLPEEHAARQRLGELLKMAPMSR